MPRKRPNNTSDEQIVAAYDELKSAQKVSAAFGVGAATVNRVLLKHNVERTGLQEYRQSERLKSGSAYAPRYEGSSEEILEMYRSGMSIRDIANKIGRSTNVVSLRVRRAGISRKWQASGPEHSMWNGGRIDDGQGYIKVWVDKHDFLASMRDSAGYIKEHRLVLARKIGRPLMETETVHHIDGYKTNNSPENLQLRQGKHGKHLVMCCGDCGSRNIIHSPLD